MHNKLLLVLSLIIHWRESAQASLGSLEYDNLDTDLSDLKYEVEKEDIDDFSKLLDESTKTDKKASDSTKSKVKTTGFKKKNTDNEGVKSQYNIGDLKKFYKTAALEDKGNYDYNDIYGIAKAIAGAIKGTEGNETRKYRKGSKSRGFHRIHHKDEYKKDKLFYEDDETKGEVKKIGGNVLGFKVDGGAGFNKGHFHHDRQKGSYGKEGYLDEGFVNKEIKRFSDSLEFDGTFSNKN